MPAGPVRCAQSERASSESRPKGIDPCVRRYWAEPDPGLAAALPACLCKFLGQVTMWRRQVCRERIAKPSTQLLSALRLRLCHKSLTIILDRGRNVARLSGCAPTGIIHRRSDITSSGRYLCRPIRTKRHGMAPSRIIMKSEYPASGAKRRRS